MPAVEEYYPEEHLRVLRILLDSGILYSIDHYARLSHKPGECSGPAVDGYRLCYKRLGRCTAVIAETPMGAELINLRLHTSPDDDPGPEGARRICLEEVERLNEVLLPPERG